MFKKLRSNSTVSHNRRTSTSDSQQQLVRGNHELRRHSQPNPIINYEVLHSTSTANGRNHIRQNESESVIIDESTDQEMSPLTTTQSNQSTALSEANTLFIDRHQRLELQDNYLDNFTMYLPFVIRQMRLIEERRYLESQEYRNENEQTSDNNDPLQQQQQQQQQQTSRHVVIPDITGDDLDDISTIFDEAHVPLETFAMNHYKILEKQLSSFDIKRLFIIVAGMLKHNTYIFPSAESFELFKQLRSSIKKHRKNLIMVYDNQGTIKRASLTSSTTNIKREDINQESEGIIIDDRPHIIPLDQKLKGLGLPLFKIQTPYLSSFRKNTPCIIFKRYKEVPQPPPAPPPASPASSSLTPSLLLASSSSTLSLASSLPGKIKVKKSPSKSSDEYTSSKDDFEFETYNFCQVYSKYFQSYRRFIFEFTPLDQPSFKVIMFQSNLRPFADFLYKKTRFRVIGPAMLLGVIQNYNPHMRLLVIDDDKPSLVDNIINKKPHSGSNTSIATVATNSITGAAAAAAGGLFHKRKSNDKKSKTYVEFNYDDPTTFINPIPNNTFADEDNNANIGQAINTSLYISNDLPPFGCFKDSMLYRTNSSLLPKKYTEEGKIQMYQDKLFLIDKDENSTLSIDIDSMVLVCIMATLRDISIKNAGRTNTQRTFGIGLGNRIGYGLEPSHVGIIGL